MTFKSLSYFISAYELWCLAPLCIDLKKLCALIIPIQPAPLSLLKFLTPDLTSDLYRPVSLFFLKQVKLICFHWIKTCTVANDNLNFVVYNSGSEWWRGFSNDAREFACSSPDFFLCYSKSKNGGVDTHRQEKNASYAFMERTFGVQHNSVKQYYAIIQVT